MPLTILKPRINCHKAHFGVSAAKKFDLVVLFPSGIEVALKDVATGQAFRVVEPAK
jgi:hypothetical protein